jgi:hypothetical protein
VFTLFKTRSYNLTLISSLFADDIHLNDIDGMVKSNDNRSINREKLNLNILRWELNGSNSRRNLIFQKLRKLISICKKTKAFHPFGSF